MSEAFKNDESIRILQKLLEGCTQDNFLKIAEMAKVLLENNPSLATSHHQDYLKLLFIGLSSLTLSRQKSLSLERDNMRIINHTFKLLAAYTKLPDIKIASLKFLAQSMWLDQKYENAKSILKALSWLKPLDERMAYYKATLDAGELETIPRSPIEKPRLIIHVGYPKCASTWFQNLYFPGLNGNAHLGRMFLNFEGMNVSYPSPIDAQQIHPGTTDFDPSQLAKHLNDNFSKGLTTSLSSEHFIMNGELFLQNIERLLKIYDVDVRILMIIRNPAKLIRSAFMNGCQQKRWDISEAEQIIGLDQKDNPDYINIADYDFKKSFQQLTQLVSEKSIVVAPLERIFSNPKETLQAEAGLGLQRQHSSFWLALKKCPPINSTSIKMADFPEDQTKKLKEIMLKAQEYLAGSTRILDQTLNLNLEELGYY